MSKLKKEQIADIKEIYGSCKSIVETAKITGHSKITVNKYVSDISSESKHSRKNTRAVEQIDFNGVIVDEYKSLTIAANAMKTDRSNIHKAISGTTDTACGYRWRYKEIKKRTD